MKAIARGLFALLTLLSFHAWGPFHLWQMTELFSNADGTIQFLEVRALSGGQQFLDGHALQIGGNSIDLRTLPGDSANRTFLVGTAGFAALGVAAPDFIVPNGFFPVGGGTIDFAENSDRWTYPALPTNGRSLNRDGSTSAPSPRNFAGQTGTFTLPVASPTFNVHGLWGNDPDSSEPGWGVNLSQHGDIIFLTWYTYDADGTGMWLIMSNATRTAANTYTGEIYRTTGAPFNAYDPSRLTVQSQGTGTLTFTDADHGIFQYRVGTVSQSKQIKRFVFGPVPTCDQAGGAATNFTDLWGLASEGGWGVNIVQQGDTVFLTWFTYDATGRGQWFVASGLTRTTGNTFTGPLYQTRGAPFSAYTSAALQLSTVGTATLSFSGASAGTFNYTVNGVTQTKNIARNVHATPATTCRG